MTRPTEAPKRNWSDADVDARCWDFVEEFDRREFIVTRRFEVEASGAALICDVKVGHLRNLRSYGCGPPFVTRRGRAWYPIRATVLWSLGRRHDAGVIDFGLVARASFAPTPTSGSNTS